MPHPSHIIFDLDGTLVDSAPAILTSFRQAFAAAGRQPVMPIDDSIIGPPLAETLTHLSGSQDPALLATLAEGFKASYDTTGLLATQAFPGVDAALVELQRRGHTLHIATNKRIHPTRLILKLMDWQDLFAAVYALDIFEPRLPHKAAMIGRLLQDQAIPADQAIYVGDREEDGLAAQANHLPFLAATWGYGSLRPEELQADWRLLRTPEELVARITG